MKKSLIFLTCFFLLITTQTLNSKEIRSMFGFYVDIPDEYELLQNLNLDDLIKENPQLEMNREFFDEMAAGSTKKDFNIEYFFPTKFNAELNNIYINHVEYSIKELMVIDTNEVCDGFRELFSSLWKKPNLKQLECKKNPKEIKLKSPVIFKFVHEGPFRKTKLMNYYLQVYKGYSTTISLLCEIKNCNLLYEDLISITNSIKK